MVNYESMYILKPDMDEEKKDSLVKRFSDIVTNNGGEIKNVDEWGKKRLAYPINYIEDGYYVLMTFTAPPELPTELERNYKISDDIMRYMVVNLDKE